MAREELTGNTRYRCGFKKKLILQVEYAYFYTTSTDYSTFDEKTYRNLEWRDARVEDLKELNL